MKSCPESLIKMFFTKHVIKFSGIWYASMHFINFICSSCKLNPIDSRICSIPLLWMTLMEPVRLLSICFITNYRRFIFLYIVAGILLVLSGFTTCQAAGCIVIIISVTVSICLTWVKVSLINNSVRVYTQPAIYTVAICRR